MRELSELCVWPIIYTHKGEITLVPVGQLMIKFSNGKLVISPIRVFPISSGNHTIHITNFPILPKGIPHSSF